MRQIELLESQMRIRIGGITTKLDPSDNPDGRWFLDLRLRERHVIVEWHPVQNFGISVAGPGDAYGEKPQENNLTYEEVTSRAIALLTGT